MIATRYINGVALLEDIDEVLAWARSYCGSLGPEAMEESRELVDEVKAALHSILDPEEDDATPTLLRPM